MFTRRRQDHPVGSLRSLATDIGAARCRPGFRGYAFINAAAGFSDPADSVRIAVDAHRRWMLELLARIATGAGMADVDNTAMQLLPSSDGGVVAGYLGDPQSAATSLGAAIASIIGGAGATRRQRDGPPEFSITGTMLVLLAQGTKALAVGDRCTPTERGRRW